MAPRYAAGELRSFAARLFAAAGMDGDKAKVTAELLVEADLMGHTTHGLHLAAPYLQAAADKKMTLTGEPGIVADRGGAVTWDGRYLPGLWLTARALDLALDRVAAHGMVGVAIKRSHHIGCLAAFLPRATVRGCMAIVTCSDPSVFSVAPYGGTKPVYTPNPIAVGIPTKGEPILIDMSASITTNGLSGRLAKEGKRLPHAWLQDAAGNPTDDPTVLNASPPGTILPTGGVDHGHKGYMLALIVEAMTQALSGFGRVEQPNSWGASVFVQVIDPGAFGGLDAYLAQTTWLADACRASPPPAGKPPVRLPGETGLAKKRAALKDGVDLYPGIVDALAPWAAKLGVALPKAL